MGGLNHLLSSSSHKNREAGKTVQTLKSAMWATEGGVEHHQGLLCMLLTTILVLEGGGNCDTLGGVGCFFA